MSTNELRQLEAQIAYSAARSDIECYAMPVYEGGITMLENRWWNITPEIFSDDPEMRATIIDPSVRYLHLCGLLQRHPDQAGWVRVLDGDGDEK